MNTTASAIPPDTPALSPAPWAVAQTVVAEAGLDAEVVLLGAGAEREYESVARQRLLYVVAGSVTATLAPTNHIVSADGTLVIPAKRALTLRNTGPAPTKIFILTLPAPRVEWRSILPEASAAK